MYLQLQSLLKKDASVGDLFVAALNSSEEVSKILPASDPVLPQLQKIQQTGPLFLDLWGADKHFTMNDIEKIVRAIKVHWRQHGFCIARSCDQRRWIQAVSDYQQPLLHWPQLSIIHGCELIGIHLRATELDVFRFLARRGTANVEKVASSSTISAQYPDFGSSPQMLMDSAMGRTSRSLVEYNRLGVRNILMRMRNRRIVVEREGCYSIVRPTWETIFHL